eukprot:3377192-Amphidinium_carterae.1
MPIAETEAKGRKGVKPETVVKPHDPSVGLIEQPKPKAVGGGGVVKYPVQKGGGGGGGRIQASEPTTTVNVLIRLICKHEAQIILQDVRVPSARRVE